MLRQNIKKMWVASVAAGVLALGLAVPGQAATLQNSTTYYFTWNGHTFKIPFKMIDTDSSKQVTTQPTTPVQTTPPTNQVEKAEVPSQVQQVVDLVNAERKKVGLSPLKVNDQLTKMAQVKAEDMRDNQYFSHTSPTYGSPFDMMKEFGVSYSYAGENIAAGQKTAEDVMKGWMNSPGHRANILSENFTEIGVGYVQGGAYGTYWVQEFIKR